MKVDNVDFVFQSTPEAQYLRRQFHGAITTSGQPNRNNVIYPELIYPPHCPWAAIHGGYHGVIQWRAGSAPPEARANTPWQFNTAMMKG